MTINTQEQAENYLIIEVQAYSQDPEFETILVTNSKTKPNVLYRNGERIIDEEYDINGTIHSNITFMLL